MKRPLFLFILFYVAGIVSVNVIGIIYSLIFISTGLAISALLLKHKLPFWFLFICAIMFVTGAIRFSYYTEVKINSFEGFAGKSVEITGIIASEPHFSNDRINYEVNVKMLFDGSRYFKINEKILLTVYQPEKSPYSFGQYVNFKGNLKIPEGQRNPGGFNYRRYLAQKKIYATAFIPEKDIVVLNFKSKNIIISTSLAARNKIIESVNRILPESHEALLNGMLVGYREDLSDDINEIFSKTGLIHILSISGLHVGFIVIPIVFISRKLRINRKFSGVITILLLVFYCFVAGFTASIIRAAIMAIIVLSAKIIYREADIFTSISLAAFIILFENPVNIFNTGFQLSFASTMSIVIFYNKFRNAFIRIKIPKIIADAGAVTVAAQAGTAPLTAFYFNSFSLVSLIANIFVLPFVQIAVTLGVIMVIAAQFSFSLSSILGKMVDMLISVILYLTEAFSGLPFASVRVITPTIPVIIFYYLILLYFRYGKYTYKLIKPAGVVIVVVYSAILLKVVNLPALEVVFLDVGEGDAIFIKTVSGKNVLIDGGGAEGTKVIPDFLLDKGVRKLDLVVATHSHDDHITGLETVLEQFPVKYLVVPGTESPNNFRTHLFDTENRKMSVYRIFSGAHIRLDKSTLLTVLYPDKSTRYSHGTLNNQSLVLKLEYKDASVLLCADIEKETESFLLKNNTDLYSDVLKIAHHGSNSSSTEEFLKAVGPKVGIISVGNNYYGHPSDIVLDRLEKLNIKYYRTDYHGAVIIKSDGKNLRIKTVAGRKFQ